MAEGAGLFPPGWLRAAGGEPADDLELAVLLVNSYDELADPPDRLATLDWYAAVLHAAGHLDVRARVDQRVRHDFAGEQGDVGGGVRCLPVLERVPDEPPGRRGRRGIGREGCAGMTRDRHETSGVYF